MKTRVVLAVLAALLLVSCAKAEPSSQEPIEQRLEGTLLWKGSYLARINRFIDWEAGVVCYTYHNSSDSAAISCVPLFDTCIGINPMSDALDLRRKRWEAH